ncbi:protein TPX2-like isoform X2 [Salvia miltiorrhiza]|uniref:protein TPX2-like isoform X2 n=1 Tax=Salvia miltiorrhiza TaxID=226208 RepID=UPI0025AC24B6|nr:protein TPX2-like isoform X2 [Salvia miltiorrhiza]
MEDFVEDCHVEIDEEYEFDASQFFDFTRPEGDSEIEEVERWFQVSGDYPNSPFIVQLNLEKILPAPASPSSCKSSKPRKGTKSTSSSSDTDSRHGFPPSKKNAKVKGNVAVEDAAKPKTKPSHNLSQPRSANFMEPTASHLAKQNAVLHDNQQSSHLCTRFQRTQAKQDDKSSIGSEKKSSIGSEKKSSIGSENHATKRQKLETGFLKKGSYLKHKFSLSHKSSKKATVPREPELGTLFRSQRRRSKNSSASSETESQKSKGSFKAHNPSNRKILQARSLPPPRKSKTPLTEFQEFHFKTRERANHHSSAKENRSSTGEKLQESPLAEEFNKLSLGPKSKRACQSERPSSVSSKASPPSSVSSKTCQQRPNQHCGARTRPHQPNITRSLDIR